MSERKKKIFIGDKELSDNLVELFVKLSIEYISEGDGSDINYHLFGDSLSNSHAISFEKNDNLKDFIESKGRAIINPGFSQNNLAKVMIERFFNEVGGIDPSASITEFLDESFSLKITNPMTIGYYQDLITENAVLNNFNFIVIRNYLNSVFNFYSYLKHSDISEIPFSVDYGYSKNMFYIQVTANVKNFLLDNLLESINESNLDSPFYSAVKMALDNTHLTDIFTIEKGSKLCFSSIWSKSLENVDDFFPSLLMHNLYTAKEVKADSNLLSKINIVKKHVNDDRLEYPGEHAVNFVDENGKSKNNNAVLIKKVVQFLEGARSNSEEELLIFNTEKYKKYIVNFPQKEEAERLSDEDINLIIDCLNDRKKSESLNNEVQKIKDNIEDDNYVEKIVESLDELEDEVQLVSGSDFDEEDVQVISGFEEEEDSIRISGTTDCLNEEVQVVSGFEEEEDDNKQHISGSTEEEESVQKIKGSGNPIKSDLINVKGQSLKDKNKDKFIIKGSNPFDNKKEVWKVKGTKASGIIKEEIQRLKGAGASNADINQKIKSLLEDEFGDDLAGAEDFFDSLSDKAVDKSVAEQEMPQSSIFDNVHVDLDFEIPDDDDVDTRKVSMLEDSVKMRDQQLGKMKKLMDRMKKEVDREREATALLQDVGGTGVSGEKMREYITTSTELKSVVNSLEREMQAKQNIIEKEKKDKEALIRNYEREKQILLGKLEKYETPLDDGSTESVADIKKKNDALERHVEELKKKISVVLENTKKNSDEMVSGSEYSRVKAELAEKNTKLSEAYTERKEAADQNKSLAFKLKAAEQRIKSYSEKLEKAVNASKQMAESGMDAKSAHRVKHLEKTNERLQALNNKTSDELAERKAELHKTKMESKALEAKIKELERKLQKKAA